MPPRKKKQKKEEPPLPPNEELLRLCRSNKPDAVRDLLRKHSGGGETATTTLTGEEGGATPNGGQATGNTREETSSINVNTVDRSLVGAANRKKPSVTFGFTPLHCACYYGNFATAEILVEHGVNVNTVVATAEDISDQRSAGLTPLHMAVGHFDKKKQAKGFEFATILVRDCKANVDIADAKGETALSTLASRLSVGDDLSLVQLLLESSSFDTSSCSRDPTSSLHRPLRTSVNNNNPELLEILLAEWKRLSSSTVATNHDILTDLLFTSVKRERDAMVTRLLQWGAPMSYDCLLYAVSRGHSKTVQVLLQEHTPVNLSTEYGDKSEGSGDSAQQLKESPLKQLMLAVDGDGRTLLHRAAALNHRTSFLSSSGLCANPVETMRLLLEFLNSISCISPIIDAMCPPDDVTALFLACEQKNWELSKLLIEHGADPNIGCAKKSMIGFVQPYYPLHWLCANHTSSSATLELLKALMENGADAKSVDPRSGDTCLHLCRITDDQELNFCEEVLIQQYGADVNATTTETGTTPLHRAVQKENLRLLQLLLRNGANPNALHRSTRGEGETALHVIAGKKKQPAHKTDHSLSLIGALLEGGADPTIANKAGETPVGRAIANGRPDLATALLEAESSFSSHRDGNAASTFSEGPATDTTLEKAKPTKEREAHFFRACYKGQLDLVRVLLKKCPVDIRNNEDQTPIHVASENDHADVIRELVSSSSTDGLVNHKDIHGLAALDLATQRGNVSAMRALLENGATIDDPMVHNVRDVERKLYLWLAGHCHSKYKVAAFGKAPLKLRRDKAFMKKILALDAGLIARAPKSIVQEDETALIAFAQYPPEFADRYRSELRFQEEHGEYLRGLRDRLQNELKEIKPRSKRAEQVEGAVAFLSTFLDEDEEAAPDCKEAGLDWRDARIASRDIRSDLKDETYGQRTR